ncbi:fumarylacetoacetate hydrolase family protein [Massilia sp. YIM B02769]|uniref:fumarylacetoacetate hydrolase family protein n=1 Tax=unclassified Massilia TaxID=2609279 RepID=UPI0025B712CF|nr:MULTISPECIES: fumarylacetoacetate hydrolase family protein [unclassified Massilia]MDN4060521.1 fumarylacetoacetate hydrolase family protein [Massilia sp. YIM B02769]
MTDYAFTPPAPPSLAIFGSSARFPIRRVFCVGRNYAAHAREMGSDPNREPPFFFTKPADAVVPAEGALPYPPATGDLHHEIELVVALRSGGADIPADEALSKIWGYGVGLDLTRRDLQSAAKENGRPWDMAKGFDASAPCSPLRPVSSFGHPSEDACIRISVNGTVRQEGTLDEMIWPIADIIAHLSRLVTLAPGDLIFTGTPSGVGALVPGDRVHGEIAGVDEFDLEVVEK